MLIPKTLKPSFDFLKELFKRFGRGNGGMTAAAVSFYVFLSLTPLLLLAAAAFGYVLKSDEKAYQTVLGFLQSNLPGPATSIRPIIEQIISGSKAATGFGIVSLLWAGSQALVNLELAINIAWGCKSRSFLKQRLVAALVLVCVAMLFFVSFGVTTVANAFHPGSIDVLGHIAARFSWTRSIFGYFLALAVTVGTFTLIYGILPNKHVPLKTALLGGVVAGLLWEIAKQGFSWYVRNFANYNAVYGSLGSIILLLIWIYYSSMLTILVAHFSVLYSMRRRIIREE